jgi:hypothetical protein
MKMHLLISRFFWGEFSPFGKLKTGLQILQSFFQRKRHQVTIFQGEKG